MSPLQRDLIKKAGNDHGFEYGLHGDEDGVHWASSPQRAQGCIAPEERGFALTFPSAGSCLLSVELARTWLTAAVLSDRFVAANLEVLGFVARCTAELDAWYARAYGPSRDELRDFGECRIRRLVLEVWDKLSPSDLTIRQETAPC